jgi:DNA-binding Lrp family transcriptional regulator
VNPRFVQILGIILVILAIAMVYLVYDATAGLSAELGVKIFSGLIAWGILGFPELAIGLWLISRGLRESRLSDVSAKLIPLVQKQGRISVDAAARGLKLDSRAVSEAADKLARRELPLVYLDQRASEIVSPSAVTLKESLLHLLLAQRRMTFDQISAVTEATDTQILEALRELSKEGKFRGVVDENSRVVYTSEAVSQLPKAVTSCPFCGGKLAKPVLPGEEETCPYCGRVIVNRIGAK